MFYFLFLSKDCDNWYILIYIANIRFYGFLWNSYFLLIEDICILLIEYLLNWKISVRCSWFEYRIKKRRAVYLDSVSLIDQEKSFDVSWSSIYWIGKYQSDVLDSVFESRNDGRCILIQYHWLIRRSRLMFPDRVFTELENISQMFLIRYSNQETTGGVSWFCIQFMRWRAMPHDCS